MAFLAELDPADHGHDRPVLRQQELRAGASPFDPGGRVGENEVLDDADRRPGSETPHLSLDGRTDGHEPVSKPVVEEIDPVPEIGQQALAHLAQSVGHGQVRDHLEPGELGGQQPDQSDLDASLHYHHRVRRQSAQ